MGFGTKWICRWMPTLQKNILSPRHWCPSYKPYWFQNQKQRRNCIIEVINLLSAVGRREGIHQSVAKEVASVFKGKTAAQLEALQLQIETKIGGKPEGVDIGYWESLLSQLKG